MVIVWLTISEHMPFVTVRDTDLNGITKAYFYILSGISKC